MPSLTIENYVKTVYQICAREGSQPATTGEIAASLQVSPGTVTSMLKTLSESGLATYLPYEGVRLTETGQALALRIIRRHRLIEVSFADCPERFVNVNTPAELTALVERMAQHPDSG